MDDKYTANRPSGTIWFTLRTVSAEQYGYIANRHNETTRLHRENVTAEQKRLHHEPSQRSNTRGPTWKGEKAW